SGMPVDNEILVGRFLVLADSRFEQRRIFQPWKTKCDILPYALQRIRADYSLTRCGIKLRSASVVGYFEPAPLVSRNAVHEMFAMVSPDWHLLVRVLLLPCRRAKEENLLSCHSDAFSDRLWKQFAQPWAAGEDVLVRFKLQVASERKSVPLRLIEALSCHFSLLVFSAFADEGLEHGLTRESCGQKSTLWLVYSPPYASHVCFGPTRRHLAHRHLLKRDARFLQRRN